MAFFCISTSNVSRPVLSLLIHSFIHVAMIQTLITIVRLFCLFLESLSVNRLVLEIKDSSIHLTFGNEPYFEGNYGSSAFAFAYTIWQVTKR